jgi:hypothetical protein
MEGGHFDFETKGATPINPTQKSEADPLVEKSLDFTESTLAQSELEALILMIVASYPMLQPPTFTATSFRDLSSGGVAAVGGVSNAIGKLEMTAAEKEHEIISFMWDLYTKTIQELDERWEKIYKKLEELDVMKDGPKSAAEYLAFLMALSSTQRADELDPKQTSNSNDLSVKDSSLVTQFNQTYHYWITHPVERGDNQAIPGLSGSYPDTSFISGSLTCSIQNVRDAIGGVDQQSGVQLSVNPVADALFACGPVSALPADYQAAAALVAALLNNGAMFKATNDTIEKAKGEPPKDIDFAINYGKHILAIVTHNLERGEPISKARASQNRLIRLMLSVMALNLLYRAVYGGMTGKEFLGLLKGELPELPDEVKILMKQLVQQINRQLPSDPAARQSAESHLQNYVDSKVSVESMMETTRLFSSLLSSSSLDSKRLESEAG